MKFTGYVSSNYLAEVGNDVFYLLYTKQQHGKPLDPIKVLP